MKFQTAFARSLPSFDDLEFMNLPRLRLASSSHRLITSAVFQPISLRAYYFSPSHPSVVARQSFGPSSIDLPSRSPLVNYRNMSDPILTPSTSDPSSSLGTFPIPSGLTPYTEQTTTILLPDDNTAFLNPIQQFNRDLSACVIGTWGKDWQGEGKVKWEKEEGKRRRTKERKAREREEREAGKKVTAGLGVADVRGDQKRVKLGESEGEETEGGRECSGKTYKPMS
jgi:hypothetical protein